MKLAYLDCSSGISGDMFLGALLDAGVRADALLAELRKIPLGDYEFKAVCALRGGLVGTHVEIQVAGNQPERHLHHIEQLIGGSALAAAVKQRSLQAFRRLAEVEGKLHGKPPEKIHFHEVGAVDAILDIVGACVGLDLLGVEELRCSPLNVGGGRVSAAHGWLPVPAPATAELLKGAPVYSSGVEAELVTPTGAAIVGELAQGFGPMPSMKVERIGYGAGARDFPGQPNLARLFLGERIERPPASAPPGAGPDSELRISGSVLERSEADDELVSVITANLDDMSPQLYGYFVERALAAGALDVSCSSIQMKKNRPGLEMTLLCRPELVDALTRLLFNETTTIGVRIHEARRKVLERDWVSVETAYGAVRMKVARANGRVTNVAPEYEDCQRLAREKSAPLKDVMLAAQVAYAQRSGKA
jgi:pyridinium-3,5-bisthiocarboxylic acid mononucleotide nickel chelatase